MRATAVLAVAAALLAACQRPAPSPSPSAPPSPTPTGPRAPADVVDLTTVDPTVRTDIRYAGACK